MLNSDRDPYLETLGFGNRLSYPVAKKVRVLTRRQRAFDLVVRATGLTFPIFFVLYVIFVAAPELDDSSLRPDRHTYANWVVGGSFGMFAFAILGVAIGVHGAEFGQAAIKARIRGLAYVAYGVACVVAGIAISFALSAIKTGLFRPSIVVTVGIFGCGIVLTILGMAAVLTGRDLLRREILRRRDD